MEKIVAAGRGFAQARRFRQFVACTMSTALGALGLVLVPASPAFAAAATVGNGITTTALNSVGMSPGLLAQDLVGAGVTVSNVTFSGAGAQAGLVHIVDPAVVSFNDGVIMSSGDIANVVGPNKSDGITGDMAGPADADLTALIAATQTVNPMTYDAAVLEFDFVPTASTVYFTYTFASDEYLEWVNLFNDVFAFYVNGQNCATLPDNSAVSIDTINSAVNPQLFRDNSFSSPPANPINIEFDGLSVELICSATVIPGQTNHIKLAIADTSDQVLDSVVMIKAHSLSTTKPESCNDGVDNDDDTLIDMNDTSCSLTTTPAPTGSSGIGSSSSAPPFTGNEGSAVVLDASALGWSPSADTVRTSWTVTGINGTTGTCEVSPAAPQPVNPDGTAAVVTALCPDDGEYIARIDGRDIEGGASWDTDVDFFVHNAPPSVTIDIPAAPGSIDLGTTLTVQGTVVDPGTSDTVTCSIDWGDGTTTTPTVVAGQCTGDHDYASVGTYVIAVSGSDAEGAAAAAATIVEVLGGVTINHPPTVTMGSPYTGTEGSPVAISASAADSDGDPITTAWSVALPGGVDAGTVCTIANAAAASTTVTCNDDVTATVTYAASDASVTTSGSTTVAVANVAPGVGITAPSVGASIGVGSSVSFAAAVTDPSTNDVLTCTIGWGDATSSGPISPANGICNASHVYLTAGTYTITVAVADDDGATTSAQRAITVTPPAPTITSLSPNSGTVGTAVTVTGTNFNGASSVTFNGIAATFSVVSSTVVTATVPVGATTGVVRVTTSAGTATGPSFTVTYAAPTLTSASPISGPIGTAVTLAGTNFTGATAVTFNGIAATFSVISSTKISTTVPAGSASGIIKVTTPGGSTTNTKVKFTISAPSISSFTPASGGIGTAVTITGANFTGATSVKFNTTAVTAFTVVNNTTIIVGVPSGATTGKVTVITPGGTAISKTSFTVGTTAVKPTLTSFTPTSGSVGTVVTLTGSNLGAAIAVTVNGQTATYKVTSATSVTVTIPAGATTGKITVTTAGGAVTTGTNFTVV